MKTKKIYMLLLVPILSFAELNMLKVNEALSSISSNKPLIFNSNKKFQKKLKATHTSLRFSSIDKANILLFPKSKNSPKMTIVGSYSELKTNRGSIGAIYLKKGRTQIMFVDERLKKEGLKLSSKYKKYLIKVCHLSPVCLLKLKK